MHDLNRKNYLIDAIGLMSIGIFSLGYVVFKAFFAELNVQIPFLDFPIFVGEILISLCLVLFVTKFCLNAQKIQGWHYFVLAYLIFVVIKALTGYAVWGPLAFRHAALLYYPIFIVFGYYFYRRDFFDCNKCLLIALIILTIFVTEKFNSWWIFTGCMLVYIVMKNYKKRMLKVIILMLFLFFTPYKYFFWTSRMMLVGNIIAAMYVFFVFFIILLSRKKKLKYVATITMMCCVVVGSTILFKSKYIQSTLDIQSIIMIFTRYNNKIAIKKDTYARKKISNLRFYSADNIVLNKKDHGAGRHARGLDDFGEMAFVEIKNVQSEIKEKHIKIPMEIEDTLENLRVSLKKMKEIPWRIQNEYDNSYKYFEKMTFLNHDYEAPGSIKNKLRNISDLCSEMVSFYRGGSRRAGIKSSNTVVFRLFIWRDMIVELIKNKPVFGISFGKPLRSISIEAMNYYSEWAKDGWVSAHNSYLHIIYRTGFIGILGIITIFTLLIRMILNFYRQRSVVGILLVAILINWLAAANFLLILELPYTAIPIWSLYGMTLAYCYRKEEANV